MNEVKFSKIAEEKYTLLVNGSLEEVNRFVDSLIKEKIKEEDLKRIVGNPAIYSYKLEKFHITMVKLSGGGWGVLDILTPSEYLKEYGIFLKEGKLS